MMVSATLPTADEIIASAGEGLPPDRARLIREAYSFAAAAHDGQLRESGDPYFSHPVDAALTVARLSMDGPSIAAALLMTAVVFLLLPEYAERLADERRPLLLACLLAVTLSAAAAASFYGELRTRSWRPAAHVALFAMLAISLWTYWPKS